MSINIISNTENKLLGRKEIAAEVSFDATTPKRVELKQMICGKVAANPDISIIRSISNRYGKKMVKVLIHSYLNKEKMLSIEPAYILVREGMKEKKVKVKKAAAPAKKK